MTDYRNVHYIKALLPGPAVLAHVDLVAADELAGPGAGSPSRPGGPGGPGPMVRESGVRFGVPLSLPMDTAEPPPWPRSRERERERPSAYRHAGLIFTFDLDELPDQHHYATVRCAVELTGAANAIAIDIVPNGEAMKSLDRLTQRASPLPPWVPMRLRHRAAHHSVATFGLRSGTFSCTYRDPTGDLLLPRSYTMLAIVEAPAEVTELSGGLAAAAEIARTIFDDISRRTAATAATTAFTAPVAPRIDPDDHDAH